MTKSLGLAIAGAGVLLGSMLSLSAQTLQRPLFDPPEASDRPTQRWLPLPQGESTDLNAQARLLQQLQELMSNENSDSPSPPLSESQLRQMEKSLNELRQQFGSDKLPNLEDIPPEWINEAFGDPLVRKQAQQLLEKYARDRQLPNPSRSSQSRSSDAVPLPRRESSSTKRQPLRSSSPKSTRDAATPDAATENPTDRNEQLDAPENSERAGDEANSTLLPKRPDAERIDALKQLFEKLKKIEGDQTGDAQMRTGPSATKERRPAESNSANDARKLPQAKPASPSNANSANNAPRPGTSNSRIPSIETNRSSSPRSAQQPTVPEQPRRAEVQEEPSSLNGTESSELKSPRDELADSMLQERIPDLSTPATETRNDKASRNSPTQEKPNSADNRSSRSPKTNDRINQPNAASPKPNQANSNAGNSNAGSSNPGNSKAANSNAASQHAQVEAEMDLKTQLERQGLGSALKSIVKKTLQEQNELNSKSKSNAQSSATTPQSVASDKSANATAADPKTKSSSNAPLKASPPSKESIASKSSASNANPWKNPQADPNVPSVQPPNSSGSSMNGLRDLAAEVWGAIRSTPGERAGSAAGNTTPNANPDLSANLGFSWQGATWVLCFLALVALAAFFLLARKRIVLAVAAREAEARVAKELLAEGIRTRADVVRAFHRFVLRRTQPVATWWNHRYVASRLTENSPQLSQVISDLASVYEQARYLPPHVELSSEEFNRVQSALSQCAAAGA